LILPMLSPIMLVISNQTAWVVSVRGPSVDGGMMD
jgi:hypothetical protein